MKARTNDFKEAIKELKEISSKITYTINGVATELGDEELNSVQPHYQGSLLKSIMKELDLDSNVDIPKETIINYQFGVLVNGSYEYINYGNYVVYSSEKQEDTNSYLIKCYDKMLYSMVEYESFATYPITIRDYIDALCTHIGLTFKNKNDYFTNYDKTIEKELYLDENGNSLNYTYRDVLDELAQATASTICINEDDDELEIRYISNAGEQTTNVSGTNLSIESEDTQVNEIELIGNTTQASTPTPSSPQEVVNVTGRQEIKAVGKNLFNLGIGTETIYGIEIIKNNSKVVFNNSTNSNGYKINTSLGLFKAGTYTFSFNRVGTINAGAGEEFALRGTANLLTTSLNRDNYSYTFTLTTDTELIARYWVNSGCSYTNYIVQFQIEKGNTATTYEPYKEEKNEINLGKNLINPNSAYTGTSNGITTTYNADQSLSYSGTTTSTWAYLTNKISTSLKTGNYTFSRSKSLAYTTIIRLYRDASNYQDVTILANTTSRSASVTNDIISYQIYIAGLTSATELNDTLYCQLEAGSQATSYSEYFTPIELCKIGTYEDKIFKTSGKNLFDKDDNTMILNSVYVNTSTGKIQSASNSTCVYIECKSNTTYTISKTAGTRFVVGSTNETPTLNLILNKYTSNANASSITFKTGANDTYLVAWIWSGGTDTTITSSQMLASVQIEKSSSATEYEPYGSGEWYVKKAIGKVVLDGSENWNNDGGTQGTDYRHNIYYAGRMTIPTALGTNNTYLSNYFTPRNSGSDAGELGSFYMSNSWLVFVDKNKVYDLAQWKTWLGTNKPIVYYVLATPTYEKLNDTLQEELNSIRLLEGLNNIMSSVPIDLTYVSGIDTLDEEYFNEDNVNFGEMYGPVNTIILSRSAESDEIAQSIPSNLSDDEKVAIKIKENQIMNFNNRDEYLYGILTRLYGLRYTQNDYSSKGICYYNVCDRYKATIFGKDYYCVMLNDDVTIESGLSENVFTEIPDTAKTEYSNTTTTDRLERKTTLIVDKQVGEIRAEISTIDDQLNGANGVTSKLNAQGQTLDIWSKSFDENGNVIALNTTNYTFDSEGLKIGKSTDDYNSLQDNTGTYYYEKDTMIGKYTKDGSVQKDLALFGKYYYGIDEENFDVSSFTRDDALFLAQLYNDSNNEEGFGHFYNGS